MSVKEVNVGDRTIRIGEFSGRKGARVLRLLEHTAKAFPEIQQAWQRYTSEYEATHTIDLDRAYARAEFGPQPLMRQEPVLDDDGKAICDDDGQPLVRHEPVRDPDGRVVAGLDPLGHLTEEDWQASGNKLRRPRSPSQAEQLVAVFPLALDLAENEVAKLLALVAMPNDEVRDRAANGTLWDAVAEQGDELLDAPFDQLVELLVAAGEAVSEQYQRKVRERLGERLTSALTLIGLNKLTKTAPTGASSTSSASTTRPSSSTGSPPPTDGASDEPSTTPAGDVSMASSTS